nr:hypothetical protein Iba_chr10aCG0280 [Ipomoea batatas]
MRISGPIKAEGKAITDGCVSSCGGASAGFDDQRIDQFCVDKGDSEASGSKVDGKMDGWIYMALIWHWKHYGMMLLVIFYHFPETQELQFSLIWNELKERTRAS